eukprot:Gb_33730 [translate_table: standard]
MEDSTSLRCVSLVAFFTWLLSICNGIPMAQGQATLNITLFPALYIFGDSTVDPGNNNHLATLVKANFPPYGRDFFDHKPTGRFCNGKIIPDFASSLLGLSDTLPAYLDPAFQGQKLLTGASFASSASGYDDTTSRTLNVITLKNQVEYFKEYQQRLTALVGPDNATQIVSRALFSISAGTDDFANNYFLNPLTRRRYSVTQYQDLLLRSLSQFIKNVYSLGARNLTVIGLPPFGCLPSQISLHNLVGNQCLEEFNQVAISFNEKLIELLETLQPNLPGLFLLYINIYDKLLDAIRNPSKYGLSEVRKGCCGTGLIETAILCNINSPICRDASKYVFWDSFHPTEKMYEILFNDVFLVALKMFTRGGLPSNP